MKFGFLGPSYPFRGGISQFAVNFAGNLIKTGHSVEMFNFRNQYPRLLFPSGNQIDLKAKGCELPSFRILTPYNPLTWGKTADLIRNSHPDVLIVSYWLPFMAPAYGYILRQLPDIKKYFLIHNIDFHEKWLFADAFTKHAMKKADGFIVLSEATSISLRQKIPASPDNIIFLFHPVFEPSLSSEERATRPKDGQNLLFFGFVKPYKGLDILLKAMPVVLAKFPKVKLTIAGDVYGDKEPYFKLIEELKLSNAVTCHFRYISEAEAADFFQGSDVCVLPYRSATQSGVTQLAFSYETPVIATNVGGIAETVQDGINGFIAESENPAALSGKIIEFLEMKDRDKFISEIRIRNRNHSWQRFTELFLEQLKS